MRQRPNILVIVTDQQRQDHVGCYGNPVVRTPNLDRLAAQGVRFDRHYVNNPLCMPGRATLFTGMTPRAHTVRTNGINLPRHLPVLPGILRDEGYQTHLVGKLHLDVHHSRVEGAGTEHGNYLALREGRDVWGFSSGEMSIGHGPGVGGAYGDWLRARVGDSGSPWERRLAGKGCGAEQCLYTEISPELHHSAWVAERTVQFLKTRDTTRPFFAWCSFPDPHHPYCPPEEYAERYPPDDIDLPKRCEGELDRLPPHFRLAYEGAQQFSGRGIAPTRMTDRQIREIIRRTYGMVSLIDHNVGRILHALDDFGLTEDTIVIFTSDHGDLMGDHWLLNKGPFHFEGLLLTPFIARWPGRCPAGTAVSSLTSHLDFVPTLLDVLGLAFPEGNTPTPPEAEHQRPPLVGKSMQGLLLGGSNPIHDVVLVENDEDYLGTNLRTVVTERFKLTCYSARPFGELFDLKEDPHELRNLWDDPGSQTLKGELKMKLLDEIMATDSPLPRRISHA